MMDPGFWFQDPGSRIMDPGSRILDPRFWIQDPDPGSWILDPGSWVQDPGSRILDQRSRLLNPVSQIQDPGSRLLNRGCLVGLGRAVEWFVIHRRCTCVISPRRAIPAPDRIDRVQPGYPIQYVQYVEIRHARVKVSLGVFQTCSSKNICPYSIPHLPSSVRNY